MIEAWTHKLVDGFEAGKGMSRKQMRGSSPRSAPTSPPSPSRESPRSGWAWWARST